MLGLLVLALVVRLALAATNAGLTMDSPTYVTMSERLHAGGYQHHGYPLLLALARSVVPGRELPGRTVSMVCGVLLVAGVYVLARRGLPSWSAAFAAGLIALHPLLAVYSGAIMSETAFASCFVAALLAVAAARPLAGGLTMGFAYGVRPEAVILLPAVGALGVRGGRAWMRFALGALVLLAAYAVFLRADTGTWTLLPKSFLVRAPVEHEYRSVDPDRVAAPRDPGLLARLVGAGPGLVRRAPGVLLRYLELLVQGWPWPLLGLSLLGIPFAPRLWLAPLALLPALALVPLQQEMRFLMPMFPSLALLAAAGARWLAGRVRTAGAVLAAAAALAGTALAWRGPAGFDALHFDDGPMAACRAAGAWLARNGRPGAAVMDRKAYVPFFAGMEHVQIGDDSYEAILQEARSRGVDYLVVEEHVVWAFRPQLQPLLDDPEFRQRETRLKAVYAGRSEPGTGVAVFEVVKDSAAWHRPREESR